MNMRPIQMVDLRQQYANIKADVDAAIHEVLDTSSGSNMRISKQMLMPPFTKFSTPPLILMVKQ
jgi:hypothetical protein